MKEKSSVSLAQFRPDEIFDLDNFAHAALFKDIEHAWDVLARIKDYCASNARSEVSGKVEPGAFITGAVLIGAGTLVESGAYIRGPAIIGSNCEIRANAYIRGQVIIGDHCVVGNASELKNTVLFDGAKAPHYNYCGDSILGRGVNLGAGTKLSNLRLDEGEIKLRINREIVSTGLRKFGAILGDGTQTGCNSVLNPGTITGKGCFIYPGAVFGGVLAAGARAK